MGLDMYLTKRIYIGGNYAHNEVSGKINIKRKDKKINIDLNKVTYIIQEIGYWRKANHIHNWFVKHCQNGIDECQETYIDIEKLKELLNTCKQVIDNNKLAKKLLPTQSGFFFGGTEYDEYYFDTIKNTIEIIENVLKDDNTLSEFYYQSSW